MVHVADQPKLVVIDEIQKVPGLLDEIHWLMVNKQVQFILSGSSPRKIIRSGANLLGGRALRYELYPLVSAEIDDFQLGKAYSFTDLMAHCCVFNYAQIHSSFERLYAFRSKIYRSS